MKKSMSEAINQLKKYNEIRRRSFILGASYGLNVVEVSRYIDSIGITFSRDNSDNLLHISVYDYMSFNESLNHMLFNIQSFMGLIVPQVWYNSLKDSLYIRGMGNMGSHCEWDDVVYWTYLGPL